VPRTPKSVKSPAAEPVDAERYRLLGARLQELRRVRGLSLKEVAERVGVSPSFLSMVERGQTDLSLTRFSRLTEYYKVQPSELLMEMNATFDDPEISELGHFRAVPRGPGVEYFVLQDENPQMIFTRLAPGAAFSDMRAHRGEDFWLLLEGKAQLHYGGRQFDLVEGQTARFSSTIPHGFTNPNKRPAHLVALCSVPYW
jgi:transcriptional regulator with XRE-family HTH domain